MGDRSERPSGDCWRIPSPGNKLEALIYLQSELYIKFSACRCQDPSRRCRPAAMRFITTKQAALGSILLADMSDILLGRSANPLANIHTEVPSAAARLRCPPPLPSPRSSSLSQSVAFPSRPKLLILVSPPLCSAANSICGFGHG